MIILNVFIEEHFIEIQTTNQIVHKFLRLYRLCCRVSSGIPGLMFTYANDSENISISAKVQEIRNSETISRTNFQKTEISGMSFRNQGTFWILFRKIPVYGKIVPDFSVKRFRNKFPDHSISNMETLFQKNGIPTLQRFNDLSFGLVNLVGYFLVVDVHVQYLYLKLKRSNYLNYN